MLAVAKDLDVAATERATRVVSQEEQEFGHVVGGHARLEMGGGLAQHSGVYGTGADGTDTDVVGLALHGQNFGQAGDSRFGNIIGTQARKLLHPSDSRKGG